jgi:uncharacterized protein
MQFSYPFRIDEKGRTATVEKEEKHVQQLIEQVLFTIQGERVNRPTFGTNINQLVFAPNSDELAAATRLLIQGALQQWLGELINVESVGVESEESTLRVSINYTLRRNQEHRTQTFTREM